ncbi:unnamed protein product [Urochloa humidicola]
MAGAGALEDPRRPLPARRPPPARWSPTPSRRTRAAQARRRPRPPHGGARSGGPKRCGPRPQHGGARSNRPQRGGLRPQHGDARGGRRSLDGLPHRPRSEGEVPRRLEA